jgi:hypothetical protein
MSIFVCKNCETEHDSQEAAEDCCACESCRELEAKLDAETKHNEILTTANAEYMETIEASKEQTRLREQDYWLLEAKLAASEDQNAGLIAACDSLEEDNRTLMGN